MSADAGSPEKRPDAMQPGVLYLVGTPIGNLQDLSFRAVATLTEADWIAAEDTRRTLKLLTSLGLKKHLVSYHQHNHRQRVDMLLEKLRQGGKVALVTDAGMPGISDPGSELVCACLDAGLAVTVVPGPSAAIVALAASGLSTERFAFEGFIPATGKARKQRLLELTAERRTMILYEAPHRVLKTLQDLAKAGLAERRLTIARELTKKFESYQQMTVAEAVALGDSLTLRGEFVLILEGIAAYLRRCPDDGSLHSGNAADAAVTVGEPDMAAISLSPKEQRQNDMIQLKVLLDQGISRRDAVRQLAKNSSRSRNDWYALALTLQEEDTDRQND